MREQWVQESLYKLGGATVLNIVIAMQPCAQFSPRCASTAPDFEFQADWQTCKAAFALLRLVDASIISYVCNPPMLCNPLSFWPLLRLCVPTTASANAIVFDDPSVQLRMPYACCQVNSPVLG